MSEPDVAQVEAVFSCNFPSVYRHFLMSYGAVRFKSYVVFTPTSPLSKRAFSLQKEYISVLYCKAINGLTTFDLANQCQCRAYLGRMPGNLLPIGNNGTGNQFCIGVGGDELGQIYYWDHNDEFDEEGHLEDLGIDLEDIEDDERPPIPHEAWFQNV